MQQIIMGRQIVAPFEVTDSYSPSEVIQYHTKRVFSDVVREIEGIPDWKTFELHIRWKEEPVPGLYVEGTLFEEIPDRVDV